MSIKVSPSAPPLTPPPAPLWGKVTAEDKNASVVRFVLADRTVSFPIAELERWELIAGNPERLKIVAGKTVVTIEGSALAVIRDALDKVSVIEVRTTKRVLPFAADGAPTSPVVRAIAVETP